MMSTRFLPRAIQDAVRHHGNMSRTARPEAYTAIQKKIGERIGWVRELVQPNRYEAARTLGLDPSTLAKIEAGSRAASIFNVISIANRYRCTTDFILRGVMSARMDDELALKLAALHPELVLPQLGKAADTGTGQDADTHLQPKIPVPVR